VKVKGKTYKIEKHQYVGKNRFSLKGQNLTMANGSQIAAPENVARDFRKVVETGRPRLPSRGDSLSIR